MAKPISDRIAAEKARRDKADARLAVLMAKAKSADRKRDTRRKIVVGAAVLVEMERNGRLRSFIREMLGKTVTRPQDRDAIADLLKAPEIVPANQPGHPAAEAEHQAAG